MRRGVSRLVPGRPRGMPTHYSPDQKAHQRAPSGHSGGVARGRAVGEGSRSMSIAVMVWLATVFALHGATPLLAQTRRGADASNDNASR